MTPSKSSNSEAIGLYEYLEFSRSWAAGLIFILPLLLLYEFGALFLGEGHVAAAQWAYIPFALLGPRGRLIFNFAVILVFLGAAISLARSRRVLPGAFPIMFLEGFIYALILGPLIAATTGLYMSLDIGGATVSAIEPRIIISAAGAGVYEELIFRGLLIGGMYHALTRLVKMQPVVAGVISILTSAVLFSALHFIAPNGDFNAYAFVFRIFAAIALMAIFVFRGIGVTCYTHAIYNVLVYLMYR